MRPFQAPLDTCLDSPFFASLSVHSLHFTVYALSKCTTNTHTSEDPALENPSNSVKSNEHFRWDMPLGIDQQVLCAPKLLLN